MVSGECNYNPTDHGFFHELVRLVICLSSVGVAFDLQNNRFVAPFDSESSLVLEGKPDTSGLEFHFFPGPLYQQLLDSKDGQPSILKARKLTIRSGLHNHPIRLDNIQLMTSRLIGDAFISYYESKSTFAKEKWGNETKRWPATWRFGQVMRNACVHDGKIFFKKENDSAVQWRSLRYDYADNGRQILFDEIAGADLIFLMEEMDWCLRSQQHSG